MEVTDEKFGKKGYRIVINPTKWGGVTGCAGNNLSNVEEKPQAARTYEAFLTNSIETSIKALSVITNYLNLDNDPVLRSKLENEEVNIYDIGNLLRLKEISLDMSRRRNGVDVTLGEELEEIALDFETTIEQSAPDPTEASSLDGFDLDEDGNLVMGGDIIISPNTIDGAITIELLNAEARGENVVSILKSLDVVTKDTASNYSGVIMEDSETNLDSRGIYMDKLSKWDEGVIPYYWSNDIPEAMKNNVLSAMCDWEEKTDYVIDFMEDNDIWHKFLSRIGCFKLLRIKK